MPAREDEDNKAPATPPPVTPPAAKTPTPSAAKTTPPPATWAERSAQREHNASARTATMPPVVAAAPPARSPEPTLRVHIEEMGDALHRPELLSCPPGRTLFDAVGPREVVATSLRAMANKFDPPWWMFWAHLHRQ